MDTKILHRKQGFSKSAEKSGKPARFWAEPVEGGGLANTPEMHITPPIWTVWYRYLTACRAATALVLKKSGNLQGIENLQGRATCKVWGGA